MGRKILTLVAFLLQLTCLLPNGNSVEKRSNDNWQRVYLASFHRSGNHWVRYLIEEATHIATSSVYCDFEPPPHMPNIFPWGGFCADHGYEGHCRYPIESEPVVIKTHYPKSPVVRPLQYVRTVRLVRHPLDCFYSYYVYEKDCMNQKHAFNIPKRFLYKTIQEWAVFQNYWDQMSNVTTFRYEDLYENPHEVLKKILDVIGYAATDEDIARAVKKHPPKGGILKHLPHYKDGDLKMIYAYLNQYLEKYGYEIPGL